MIKEKYTVQRSTVISAKSVSILFQNAADFGANKR